MLPGLALKLLILAGPLQTATQFFFKAIVFYKALKYVDLLK